MKCWNMMEVEERENPPPPPPSPFLLVLLPLTHNTIRRLRLLRWILKDLPEIITFSFSFIFILLLLFQGGADGCALSRAREYEFTTCVRAYVCVRMYV